jgi:hypothetical protein
LIQKLLFVSVNGPPVVLQNAARVAAIRVPTPIGEMKLVLLDEVYKLALPDPFLRASVHLSAAKLAHKNRRDAFAGNIVKPNFPALIKILRKAGFIKPTLVVNPRPIFVGRIDQLVGTGQAHGIVSHALQVAAPPVNRKSLTRHVFFYPFDHHQPVGIHVQNAVSGSFSGQAPVSRWVARAPACSTVWLVFEVGPNDVRLVSIAVGQHCPGANPVLLGKAVPIPQFRNALIIQAVAVQHNHQALALGFLNH